MNGYEGRVKIHRAVALISVLLILVTCSFSIIMFSGQEVKDPNVIYDRTGENDYELTLVYDVRMMAGSVKVELKEGTMKETCNVSVTPTDDDGKILKGTFHTNETFTDPSITVYDSTTGVYASGQIVLFGFIAITAIPLSLILAMTVVRALTTSVRRYHIGNRDMTLYCGMIRHEMSVDGSVIGKVNTWIPFMTGKMECGCEDGIVMIEISIMNSPSVYFNGYLVQEMTEEITMTENTLNTQG